MHDHETFYFEMTELALQLQQFLDHKEALGISDTTAQVIDGVVLRIISAAERLVPGGFHTELFDITYGEVEDE